MKEKTRGLTIARNILLVIACAVTIADTVLMIIQVAVGSRSERRCANFKDTDEMPF